VLAKITCLQGVAVGVTILLPVAVLSFVDLYLLVYSFRGTPVPVSLTISPIDYGVLLILQSLLFLGCPTFFVSAPFFLLAVIRFLFFPFDGGAGRRQVYFPPLLHEINAVDC